MNAMVIKLDKSYETRIREASGVRYNSMFTIHRHQILFKWPIREKL
jgi:hypothetical protein